MSKFLVTRVRNVLEAITVDAESTSDAIEKSRKTKRAEWSHLDSKRRHNYEAKAVSTK